MLDTEVSCRRLSRRIPRRLRLVSLSLPLAASLLLHLIALLSVCTLSAATASYSTMRPTPPSWLKVLVPIKRTVDYAVKIRVGPKGVETQGVKHSLVSYLIHYIARC